MITTKEFWLGAFERAVKTFFQTLVAVLIAQLGAEAVGVSAGILAADWLTGVSVAAMATALSVFTSIGNARFTAGTSETPVAAPSTLPTEPRDPNLVPGPEKGI